MKNTMNTTRAPGGVDLSFGEKGTLRVPNPENPSEYLSLDMIVVEPLESETSERIYVGGRIGPEADPDQYLIRLTENGQLDASFGDGGYCKVPDTGPRYGKFDFRELVFGDGVLTCIGKIFDMHDPAVQIYMPAAFRVSHSGHIDRSFGRSGMQVYTLPVPADVSVAHNGLSQGLKLYEAEGVPRTGLARSSMAKTPVSSRRITQADGKLTFLANIDDIYSEDSVFGVICSYAARMSANGQLDTSFGDGGVRLLTVDVDGTAYLLKCAGSAVDDFGRIAVGGAGFNDHTYVVRLNKEGDLDVSFGAGGCRDITLEGARSWPYGFIKVDNELVTLCQVALSRDERSGALIKLTSAGEHDPEFNGGKPLIISFTGGPFFVRSLGVDQGRRLIIGGAQDRNEGEDTPLSASLTRVMPKGMLDTSFGVDGHSLNDEFEIFYQIAVQGSGKSLAIVNDRNSFDYFVMRFFG